MQKTANRDRLYWKILKMLIQSVHLVDGCFLFNRLSFSFDQTPMATVLLIVYFAPCVRLLLIFPYVLRAHITKYFSIAFCVVSFFVCLYVFLCSHCVCLWILFAFYVFLLLWHKSVHFLGIANYMWEIVRLQEEKMTKKTQKLFTWKMWCKTLWKINSCLLAIFGRLFFSFSLHFLLLFSIIFNSNVKLYILSILLLLHFKYVTSLNQ